jgi:hypothetical protein
MGFYKLMCGRVSVLLLLFSGAVRCGVVLSELSWVWKQGCRTLSALELMSAFG